jgi:hypothetical protein
LPPRAFAHKREKQLGCNLFAVLSFRSITLHAKSCYALVHFTDLLFFPLFPEAVLLTRKKKSSPKNAIILLK